MAAEKLMPLCKPGDLIEFYRGKYCHWAMYSDTPGYVFNIDAEDKSNVKSRISLRKLVDVANSAARPEHRVVRKNNKTKSAWKRGLKEQHIDKVLKAARDVLNTDVPYGFLSTNCEFYCCKWKFGEGWTDQVENVVDVSAVPRGGPLGIRVSPTDVLLSSLPLGGLMRR